MYRQNQNTALCNGSLSQRETFTVADQWIRRVVYVKFSAEIGTFDFLTRNRVKSIIRAADRQRKKYNSNSILL